MKIQGAPGARSRRRIARGAGVALAALLGVPMLASCQPSQGTMTVTTLTSSSQAEDFPLQHDWGPAIAMENGVANSCIVRKAQGTSHEHLCRTLDGHGPTGDRRNWRIEGGRVVAKENRSGHGWVLVYEGGTTYEGCRAGTGGSIWVCAYRVRQHAVLQTNSNSKYYYLRALKQWAGSTTDALSCASAVVAVWRGGRWTVPALAACRP
jgi:hypothetical protein